MSTRPGHKVPVGYDIGDFPPFAVTTDRVVLTIRQGRLSVLLVERWADPYAGYWALPGGFVLPDETLEEAANRELRDETDLAIAAGHLEQIGTYGDPDRDPRGRVVSVAYLALVPETRTPIPGSDARDVRWWPVEDLGTRDGPELAFDHEQILSDGIERSRAKLEYTSLATLFVQEPFTLSELRHVYEAVWGVVLEPANFRRKVLGTPDLVVATGNRVESRQGRPAELYKRGRTTYLHPAILRPELSRDT
jgi:8-oxo-dGTP diphosphatase